MNIFRYKPLLWSSAFAIGLFSSSIKAQDLNQLKDIAGSSGLGGGVPSLGSLSSIAAGSTGNAAGIIGFCLKNNYLGGEGAASVRDQLLGKMTSSGEQSPETNADYISGTKGIVCCASGPSVDLSMSSLKASVVKKACEKVLEQGKSML